VELLTGVVEEIQVKIFHKLNVRATTS